MQQLPTSLDTWAAHTVTRTHMRACILAAQLLDDPYSLNAESPSGFCTAGWFRNISPGDTLSHAARYASTHRRAENGENGIMEYTCYEARQ